MKIQSLKNHKKNAKGFALTEVLLAIAVIVIIGIAAYPLYKNARTSSEVESMANDIAIIETSTQTLYSGQSAFTGLTPTQLENAGMVPDDLKTGTVGTWNNAWGGTVSIAPASNGAAADSLFAVTVSNIPQSACTQLVNRVAPSFLMIGDTSTADSIKPMNGKVNINNIANVCVAAGASLVFTAR